MLNSKLAKSIYNDLIDYNDRSVEDLHAGLQQAKKVLTIYKDNETAIAYIEAVEKYFKNKLN